LSSTANSFEDLGSEGVARILPMKAGDIEIFEKGERCSFVAVQVLNILPSGKKTFVEATDELKKIWKERYSDRAIYDRARALVDRISSPKVIKDRKLFDMVVETGKLSKKLNMSISRVEAEKGSEVLPSDLAKQLFMVKPGSVIGPYKNADNSYSILVLREIVKAKDSEVQKEMDVFLTDLSAQRRYDYLDGYESYLRQKYPVIVGEDYQRLSLVKSIVRG
jgi:hypothetical protein